MRFRIPAIILFLCIFQTTGNASVYLPAGLNPGDEYQLVFLTSGQTDATSNDIGTYNIFVQGEAEENPQLTGTDSGVTYKASVVLIQSMHGITRSCRPLSTISPVS